MNSRKELMLHPYMGYADIRDVITSPLTSM